jgi:hypothetical protein
MLKKDEPSSSVQTTYQLYNAEEGNVNGYSEPPQLRQRSVGLLLDICNHY